MDPIWFLKSAYLARLQIQLRSVRREKNGTTFVTIDEVMEVRRERAPGTLAGVQSRNPNWSLEYQVVVGR